MNNFLIALHNVLRWVVFIIGVVVLIRALRGWLGSKPFARQDRLLGMMFTSAFDLQILLGLILYFLTSSYGLNAFLNQPAGEVMGNAVFRLFAVEHPLIMFAAAAFAHLGSALAKKARNDRDRHGRAAVFFAFALLLLLAGNPWSRSLFPRF
jgi:uncharacterized membrane protein YecN with MAPEG domain